jgi:hypothetical protein
VQCRHDCVDGVCVLRWEGERNVSGLTDGAFYSVIRTVWTSWDGGTLDLREGPRDGGDAVTLTSVPASAGVPATTAQDNSAIYFTTGSAVSGAVYRIALDAGGVPQALASNQDGPGALLLTDAGVYWTNYFGGEVMHTGAAGTPEVVAGGQLRPRQLTSDDDRLYWVNEGTDGGDGSVMAVPLAGGPPVRVSDDASGGAPTAIDLVTETIATTPRLVILKVPIWVDRRSRQLWGIEASTLTAVTRPFTGPWDPRQLIGAPEFFYVFNAATPALYGPDRIYVPDDNAQEPPFNLLIVAPKPVGTIAVSAPWHLFWTDGSTISDH